MNDYKELISAYGYEVKIWNAKDVDAWNRRVTNEAD